jgi:hypothetical protein
MGRYKRYSQSISAPITEDSMTRFPRNQSMEKEIRRFLFATHIEVARRAQIQRSDMSVVMGSTKECEIEKS